MRNPQCGKQNCGCKGRFANRPANEAISEFKEKIDSGAANFVLTRCGHIVYESALNGINAALEAFETCGEMFAGASAFDKIVGKAAAFIFILGGAKYVHGKVMSRPAYRLLTQSGVAAEYGILTDTIKNRSGNGMCPIEYSVKDAAEPEKGIEAIKKTLARLKND